jgi:hypothetical protein
MKPIAPQAQAFYGRLQNGNDSCVRWLVATPDFRVEQGPPDRAPLMFSFTSEIQKQNILQCFVVVVHRISAAVLSKI